MRARGFPAVWKWLVCISIRLWEPSFVFPKVTFSAESNLSDWWKPLPLLSLIPPSLSPPLVTLYHFSSSSSCSFVFHFTFHFSSHPLFWGTADVPMATIGSMFVWYICGPLITLLAGDNNSTSRPELQTEKCQQIDGRKREIMQNDKLRIFGLMEKRARRSFQFLFKSQRWPVLIISASFFSWDSKNIY